MFDLKSLPKESVLPIVADRVFVKNKSILLDGKFSLGLGGGVILTEALFNNASVFFNLNYHFSEAHAFSLNSAHRLQGLSDAGQAARQSNPEGFRLDLAPYLKAFHYGLYKYTAYYGKISLSHNWVMNLTTSLNVGGGLAQYNDKNFPLLALGADQSFYFNSNLALNFSLGLLVYQGSDIFCRDYTSCDGTPGNTGIERPPGPIGNPRRILSEELSKIWYEHTYLKVGLIYLF